jgi:hypothetical protein
MMHFRTLDWGMDGLRDVLVVLEFVRSESETPEKVLYRTVSYAGFVGVLTGVRLVYPFWSETTEWEEGCKHHVLINE